MRVFVLQAFIVTMVASLDLMLWGGPPPRAAAPTALVLPPLVFASAEAAEAAERALKKSKAAPAPDQAQATSAGPCASPRHREFDFWIGDWDVVAPDGRPLGTNRIEVILDGCALAEHWTGAGGSRGRSFSLYVASEHRWHQTWVDSGGRLLVLEGGLVDGSMVVASDHERDGRRRRDEVRWTPLADHTVRQQWRRSEDGGCTWTEVFVGLYRRRP